MHVHICQRNAIGNVDTKLKRDYFLDDSNLIRSYNRNATSLYHNTSTCISFQNELRRDILPLNMTEIVNRD